MGFKVDVTDRLITILKNKAAAKIRKTTNFGWKWVGFQCGACFNSVPSHVSFTLCGELMAKMKPPKSMRKSPPELLKKDQPEQEKHSTTEKTMKTYQPEKRGVESTNQDNLCHRLNKSEEWIIMFNCDHQQIFHVKQMMNKMILIVMTNHSIQPT